MGDLVKGVTFADGEAVTAARLNALVDDATIKPGTVGTAELEDGSVTGAKLAGSLAVAIGNLAVTEGSIIIGDSSDEGSEATLNSTNFEVVGAEIRLKDAGIANAKLAGSIAADKLAGGITSAQLTAVGTAGTYGSATQVPRITTDVAGRVTGVTLVTIAQALTVATYNVPATGGTSGSIDLAAAPVSVEVWMKCVGAEGGYSVGDYVAVSAFSSSSSRPALAPFVKGLRIGVRRCDDSTLRVVHGTDGSLFDATSGNWNIEFRYR